MRTSIITFASLSFVHHAAAWGAVGHQTVALIAQSYLNDGTKAWVSNLLGEDMVDVATWADSYRYTSAGHWSAPMHFIDSQDSPPHSCGVDFERDCGDSCVVSAIANYTGQVQDTTLPDEERQTALKFLIHFFGDITQPLHCEALDVGGNTIDVTWNGASTNLHAVWDTPIPNKLAGGTTVTAAKSWSQKLITNINSGAFANMTASWTSCSAIDNAQNCAMTWASDANLHVCSDVLAGGVASVQGSDLSGDYFTKAAPIVTEQIAKGGYRLGDWLNKIYAAQKGANLVMFE